MEVKRKLFRQKENVVERATLKEMDQSSKVISLLFQHISESEAYQLSEFLRKDHSAINSHCEQFPYALCSPLLMAAKNGRLDCLKLLVRFGANIQSKDAAGRNGLHWAACRGHFLVVKYFIEECMFDPLATTKKGYTAADFAKRSGNTKTYDYLRNVG